VIEPELEVRRCRVPFRLHLASGSDDPENVGSTWMDLALEKFRVFAEEIDHGDEPPNDCANVLDNGTRRGTALKRCVSLRKARASGGTVSIRDNVFRPLGLWERASRACRAYMFQRRASTNQDVR